MKLYDVLVKLKATPLAYLESESIIAMQAFMGGYVLVDESAREPCLRLAEGLDGPSVAGAWLKAYLRDGNAGFSLVLEHLIEIVGSSACEPIPGVLAGMRFIDYVRDPIISNRPGMVAGELSVVWLIDAMSGYLAGLDVLAPARAEREREQLLEFGRWLQGRYQANGSWGRLLRVFEGADPSRGLRRFVQLFDEFERKR